MLGYARTMQQWADEDLMRCYADGDSAAFEVIYQRFRGPLYRYVLRHVRDATLANDLYQGAWEKVIAARKRYPSHVPFRAWLFRIARNHVIDHFRAARDEDAMDESLHASAGPMPDERAEQVRRQAQFRHELERLPPDQRDALLLHFEGGLSLNQISDVTGVGAETVKSRLRYATRKLKQVLSP